jgi:hypothetical protein
MAQIAFAADICGYIEATLWIPVNNYPPGPLYLCGMSEVPKSERRFTVQHLRLPCDSSLEAAQPAYPSTKNLFDIESMPLTSIGIVLVSMRN